MNKSEFSKHKNKFSEFFVKEGYKIGRSSNLMKDFCVYREINETDFKCSSNKKNPNLYIWLHEDTSMNGEYRHSMEINAAVNSFYDSDDYFDKYDSGYQNNDWTKLEFFGIYWDRLITSFKELENSLIRAWNAMHEESEIDIN
jgi:hypothetical protein